MAKVVNILGLIASVDLEYLAFPTEGVITNTGGTDAVIPLVDSINAGLMSPEDFNQLNNIVTQVITDGDTTHAPSGDAVFDALSFKAPLASPALTGIPTAPTAAPGTNNTQIATTAFVENVKNTIDGSFVHRTGNINEDINGSKTFNPSVSAVAGIARGTYINPSLTAIANNDSLIGLDINPSFTNGSFTGVSNLGLRVTGSALFNNFVTASAGLQGLSLAVNRNANTDRELFFQSSLVNRWIVKANNTAESGGNAGSDFELLNRNDSGSAISTALFIKRSTGNVVINGTTDAGYKFDVNGSTRLRSTLTLEANPATSAGTYDILTRNTSTGIIEKSLNSGFVHIAGPETITGNKTIATAADTNGLFVDVLAATLSPSGILVNTKGTTSVPGVVGGVSVVSTGNKNAGFVYSPNASGINNKGFFYNKPAGALAGSFAFQLRENNSLDLFTVNDLGELNAMKLTKIGGTSVQYLMADGSVSTAANITIPATQVTATPHTDYLVGSNVQVQLDNTETNIVGLYKIDKTSDKTLKQTGRYRPDTDVSVLSISPADTLNITACDNILFVNEILPDSNANKVPDFLKSFGNKSFVVNGTNTPLAANTRGIFYVGLDKLGAQVYRTSKIYDQDVAYLARILVNNTAGVYSIVSFKYIPDLVNNRINNRDRFVLSSGYIVPSGAASISFGNRAMTFTKNSINYSNNKLDPNHLVIADSVNPTPMSFLFFLPNITSLAVNIATSTVMDPTVWYTAGGTAGVGAVNPTHYQVYKLFITVTGTIAIQTKASTVATPDPGVNAIFATRDAALAGLTSTIFPDVLPAGDSIALGTFYLRAGMAVNGSTMNDPMDFYFRPIGASTSSSTVGVTVHDNLSGKNDNPAFQHVTTTDINNWNSKPTGSGVLGQVAFWGSSSALTGDSGLFWNNTNKRLGVGITTPISKLQVETLGAVGSGFGEGARISSGTMGVNIGVEATNTYAWIQPSVNGGGYKNIVLNPYGGNVGIGQPSPSSKLDINFNGASQSALRLNSIDPGAGSGIIRFIDNNTLKWSIATNPSNDFYVFNEDGAGSGYGLFVQKSTNNVGIGNSSPTQKLTVTGNILASQFIKNGATTTNILLAGGGDIAQSTFASDSNVVHKTGDESITGQKTFTTTGVGAAIIANTSGANSAILANSSSTFPAISITGSTGLNVSLSSTGDAVTANMGASATGLNFVGKNNASNTFTVNKLGVVTGTSFVKSGATATNILLAGGTDIPQSTFASDANVVHLSGTETISGLKTFTPGAIFSAPVQLPNNSVSYAGSNVGIGGLSGNFAIMSNTSSFGGAFSTLSLSASRTYTLPNANGTLALTSDLSGFAPASGSANYIQNQNASAQSANMWISGNGRFGNGVNDNFLIQGTSTGAGIKDLLSLRNLHQTVGVVDGVRLKLRDFTIESSSTYGSTDNILTLGVNTSKQITLLQNGNVGIGTTNPTAGKLQVEGNIYFKPGFTVFTEDGLFNANATPGRWVTPGGKTGYFGYKDYSGNQYFPRIGFGSGTANWAIGSEYDDFVISKDNGNGSNGLTVRNGGNVLIGTTTDNGVDKLQVNGSSSIRPNTSGLTLSLFHNNTGSSAVPLSNKISWFASNSIECATIDVPDSRTNVLGVPMIFKTRNDAGTLTEWMRIANGGNVGIGTASFVGTEKVNISYNSSTTFSQGLNIRDTNASANGNDFIVFRKSDNIYLGTIKRSATDNSLYIGGNDYLALGSGNTEKVRILNNGNVLIGTTTDNGVDKLQVNGNILVGNSVTAELKYNSTSSGSVSSMVLRSNVANTSSQIQFLPNGTSTILPALQLFDSSTSAAGCNITLLGRGNSTLPNSGTTYLGSIISGNSNANSFNIGFLVSNTTDGRLESLTIKNTGQVQIAKLSGTGTRIVASDASGNLSAAANFTHTGNITVTGTVTASGGFFNSDLRLKDIISRDGDVINFKWKDRRDDKIHVGVIAQEVQEYMPDSVQEGQDGMLSVNYIEVLLAKITAMEKRIIELESKLN